MDPGRRPRDEGVLPSEGGLASPPSGLGGGGGGFGAATSKALHCQYYCF